MVQIAAITGTRKACVQLSTKAKHLSRISILFCPSRMLQSSSVMYKRLLILFQLQRDLGICLTNISYVLSAIFKLISWPCSGALHSLIIHSLWLQLQDLGPNTPWMLVCLVCCACLTIVWSVGVSKLESLKSILGNRSAFVPLRTTTEEYWHNIYLNLLKSGTIIGS